jgi:hypothetical protein
LARMIDKDPVVGDQLADRCGGWNSCCHWVLTSSLIVSANSPLKRTAMLIVRRGFRLRITSIIRAIFSLCLNRAAAAPARGVLAPVRTASVFPFRCGAGSNRLRLPQQDRVGQKSSIRVAQSNRTRDYRCLQGLRVP